MSVIALRKVSVRRGLQTRHLRPSSNVDFIRQIELNLPCIRDLGEQRVCSVKTKIVSELEPQNEPVFSYRLPIDSSKRVAHGSGCFCNPNRTCRKLKNTPPYLPFGKSAHNPVSKRIALNNHAFSLSLPETPKGSIFDHFPRFGCETRAKVSGVSHGLVKALPTLKQRSRKGGHSEPSSNVCPTLTLDPWHGPPRRSFHHVPRRSAARDCSAARSRVATLQTVGTAAHKASTSKGGRP